ncbi:MAG: hypothetical protein JSS34_06735 [Proteobacteria bacterium]|nr:hypothetical protein [Pseudomonadota bacterium]
MEKIQRHFREVARKIYAIHEIISKLLSQDLESPSTLEDIHILLRENNLILRYLVQGYPIESSPETIDIHTLLNQIQTIFQSEITSKNIRVRISPKSEITAHTNKLALEIVLYNIYVHLMDRFSQNNALEISLYKDTEGRAHLDFRDNGYVMRHKKGTPEEKKDQSLFHLTQEELSDFVRILGWKLEWTQEKRGLNYIKLTLPLPILETEKVIRLSDFKGSLL